MSATTASRPILIAVESAFAESFAAASDLTSFLRAACVPFEAEDGNGARLVLLRVECETAATVGQVSLLADGNTRYTALPSRMAKRRRRLRFVYLADSGPRLLTLAEVRRLQAAP